MAARTMSLPAHEIDFLKETLHAQQELLQKLYNELDEERESSSVAADEALSMILRLQGEKSALEMEASQYKRIAEEKMCHAQETLEIFQELIYQKEMQIASLEFQVQAYRFKLVSMGCEDLGVCETQYPENMLSRKNGESSSRGTLRRGSSLPPPPVNGTLSRRVSTEGATSWASSPKMWQENKGSESSGRKEQGYFNSYCEEIRKLDKRVKELDNRKGNSFTTTMDRNHVLQSSAFPIQTPSAENSPDESDFCEYPENVISGRQACGASVCSTSVQDPSPTRVQDIFEVPICSYNNKGDKSIEKESHTLTLECEKENRKLDVDSDETWMSDVKDKFDWEKKPLLSPNSNKSSPQTNDGKDRIDWEKKLLRSGSNNESPKPKDGRTDKPFLYKHPTLGVSDFELQQVNRRLKQLEDQRFVTRGNETNGETTVELRVLREIRDDINSLKAEITSWRTKKPLASADRSSGCLKEVLLCFWP